MKTLFVCYECPAMKGNAIIDGFDEDYMIKGMEEIHHIKESILKISGIQGVSVGQVYIKFLKWLPYG